MGSQIPPRSSRQYQQKPYQNPTGQPKPKDQRRPSGQVRPQRSSMLSWLRNAHPLLYLGIGMLGMLALWQFGNIVYNWVQVTRDDWTYQRPRTFQIDQVVGHNDGVSNPSHFIALNLHSQVEIIELPGGDPSKSRIYLGPTIYGDASDLVPVTLTFKDVTLDGKLDMLVHFGDKVIVFINTGSGFRPMKPGENKVPVT